MGNINLKGEIPELENLQCPQFVQTEYKVLVPKYAKWIGQDLVWNDKRITFSRINEDQKTQLLNKLETMEEDFLQLQIVVK